MTSSHSHAARYLAFQPRPHAAWRLYCFPYAGGSAAAYRTWAFRAPSGVEVVSCQMPGRHDRYREAHPSCMERLVETLTRDFLDEHDDRPFVFFGHSLGALVAFLVARNLEHEFGFGPLRLGLSARSAPQHQSTTKLSKLPYDELLRVLTALGGMPKEILAHEEMLMLLMEPLVEDLRLSDEYQFKELSPLTKPIPEVFSGCADQMVLPGTLEMWASNFTRPLRIHHFRGGHFFLWDATEQILSKLCAPVTNGTESYTGGM